MPKPKPKQTPKKPEAEKNCQPVITPAKKTGRKTVENVSAYRNRLRELLSGEEVLTIQQVADRAEISFVQVYRLAEGDEELGPMIRDMQLRCLQKCKDRMLAFALGTETITDGRVINALGMVTSRYDPDVIRTQKLVGDDQGGPVVVRVITAEAVT